MDMSNATVHTHVFEVSLPSTALLLVSLRGVLVENRNIVDLV